MPMVNLAIHKELKELTNVDQRFPMAHPAVTIVKPIRDPNTLPSNPPGTWHMKYAVPKAAKIFPICSSSRCSSCWMVVFAAEIPFRSKYAQNAANPTNNITLQRTQVGFSESCVVRLMMI